MVQTAIPAELVKPVEAKEIFILEFLTKLLSAVVTIITPTPKEAPVLLMVKLSNIICLVVTNLIVCCAEEIVGKKVCKRYLEEPEYEKIEIRRRPSVARSVE